MGEASKFFEGEGAVQQTLQKITSRLRELGIRYAAVGGMALFYHGLRRFTETTDVERAPAAEIDLIAVKLEYLLLVELLFQFQRDQELRRRHGRRGAAGRSRSGEAARAAGGDAGDRHRGGCGHGAVRRGERRGERGEHCAQEGASQDRARIDHDGRV